MRSTHSTPHFVRQESCYQKQISPCGNCPFYDGKVVSNFTKIKQQIKRPL